MAPILTPSLTKLRSGFNLIAPNRDKESDGWIGDQRHQAGPSGHNPDETGNAERRDADNIDEVRAIDVDKDLRQPGLTMQMCVQRTLATPNDRKRLIYVIWNGTIWGASWGWTARRYTGINPHDHHAHFSGHPAFDNDVSPWGIEELADNMDPAEIRKQVALGLYDALWVAANGQDLRDLKYSGPGSIGSSIRTNLARLTVGPMASVISGIQSDVKQNAAGVAELLAQVAQMQGQLDALRELILANGRQPDPPTE